MKTKRQFRVTPLFSSTIMVAALITVIFLIIFIKDKYTLICIEASSAILFLQYFILLLWPLEAYNEIYSGICRYRILKEKVSDEDIYFIQSKPLLLPIFPWKGKVCEKFVFMNGFDEYMCDNIFYTLDEALRHKGMVENNSKERSLFITKIIEVV